MSGLTQQAVHQHELLGGPYQRRDGTPLKLSSLVEQRDMRCELTSSRCVDTGSQQGIAQTPLEAVNRAVRSRMREHTGTLPAAAVETAQLVEADIEGGLLQRSRRPPGTLRQGWRQTGKITKVLQRHVQAIRTHRLSGKPFLVNDAALQVDNGIDRFGRRKQREEQTVGWNRWRDGVEAHLLGTDAALASYKATATHAVVRSFRATAT